VKSNPDYDPLEEKINIHELEFEQPTEAEKEKIYKI
jgi:hypothetical protein